MDGDICITGMGMASALGHDARTCCSAARAGISRATELDYFQIKSEEDGELEKIKGHAIPFATMGFEGYARLLAISRLAIADLMKHSRISDAGPEWTGVYLAFPNPKRIYTGMDLISDEAIRKDIQSQIDNSPESSDEHVQWMRLVEKVKVSFDLPIDSGRTKVFSLGHCGFAAAVKDAVSDLRNRSVSFALIGGIDSLLEEDTLQWLLNTERLKTEGIAAGLQPGEAGVFLLLERHETAIRHKSKVMGRISGIGEAEDNASLLSSKPATGIGTGEAIARSLNSSKSEFRPPFWFITDQNGEIFRANDWGHALTRLIRKIPEMEDATLWYSAASFGDTGAASGFVSTCMALCGFERGYAPSDTAMVLSASDGNMRSCIRIQKEIH